MSGFEPDQFLNLCYAAALDVELWQRVLDEFGQAVGARGSLIVSHDPSRTADTMHSSCLQDVGVDYSKTWWKYDSRIARAKSLGLKPGTICVDAAFFSPNEKARDPFFQEFFFKHGLDDMAAYFSTDPHGGGIATVSAPREAARGPFEPHDIARLRQLAPHVTRAFHLSVLFGAARRHIGELTAGLDCSYVGSIVLDSDRNVVHLSEVAERLIARCFRVRSRRPLQGLTPQLHRELEGIVSAALSSGKDMGRYASLFPAVGSGGYLYLEAVALGDLALTPAILHPRGGRVLLLVRDAFARVERSIVPHLQKLGLTQAEAHAAMLVGRGRSPREAAQALNISEHTVRAQLRSSFAKLNINRQGELSYMVSQIDTLARGAS